MQSKQTLLGIAIAFALADMAMAEDTTQLDEVVVTAPAMSDPLTVVTDPKAPRQPVPAADGADYLKNIPGFAVIRKGGTDGDPVLRGLGGSRLNVLMDGQSILGGCGGRMDPPTAYVFPESYDRIVVLKGPQTVVNGGGTLAGSAIFERRTPQFETAGVRGFAGALGGSFNRKDVVADVTGGGSQGFVRMIGTNSSSDDYKDGNGNKIHSHYSRWSGSAIGGLTPTKDTRLELSYDRSNGEAAYADRGMDGVKFDRTGYGAKFETNRVSSLVEKIEAQAYHNYIDHVMDNFTLRTKPAMMNFMLNNPDRTTEGGRVSTKLALTENTGFQLGLDYQKNKHTTRGFSLAAPIDIESRARIPDMTFENRGVFGEIRHSMNDANRLIGGARYDQLDVQNEKTTGSGALASITDKTRAGFLRYEHSTKAGLTSYAGVGHAERPADWWERSSFNAFFLSPEKSSQLDVGMIYAGGAWRAGLSGFYGKINDFILTRGAAATPTASARNIDATTYGGEADVTYALSDNWKTLATLAWTHSDNDTDKVPLAQTPPLEARLGLNYDNKTWLFGMLARGAARQDRVDIGSGGIAGQDTGPTAGFGVLSLNAGYRLRKNALLTAGVDNVFDKAYAEHLNRSGTAVAGFPPTTRVNEPGRNIWVKASFSF